MSPTDDSAEWSKNNADGTVGRTYGASQNVNGNGTTPRTETSEKRKNHQIVSDPLPDVFKSYVETLQPYALSVLKRWFGTTGGSQQTNDGPVQKHTRGLLGRLVDLYDGAIAGTWLERLEAEYKLSEGFLDFAWGLVELAVVRDDQHQSRLLEKSDQPKTRNEILRICNKNLNREIEELSSIHRKLENTAEDPPESFRIDHYIRGIARAVLKNSEYEQPESTLSVYAENITVPVEKTPILGMVVHELITDFVQDASVGGTDPRIGIALGAASSTATLTVQQTNGATEPEDETLNYVRQLVEQQLQGTLELKDNDPGPSRVISFPIARERKTTNGGFPKKEGQVLDNRSNDR